MSMWNKIKSVFKLGTEKIIEGIQWLKARKGFTDFLSRNQAAIVAFILGRVVKGGPLHPIKEELRAFIDDLIKRETGPVPDNWKEGAIFFIWEHLKATDRV